MKSNKHNGHSVGSSPVRTAKEKSRVADNKTIRVFNFITLGAFSQPFPNND